MSLTPTPQQLAHELDDAGELRITRITHLTGRQILVKAMWQGQPILFQTTITDVLSGEVPDHPRHRAESVPRNHTGYYDHHYTEEQVRELGLPLYLAEEWLKKQKERLGSFSAISREFGYPETTLNGAGRSFGWPLEKPRRSDVKAQVIAAWRAGSRNKSALAEEFQVSIGSVFNWVKDLP